MLTDSALFAELEGLNRFAFKLCRNKCDAEDLVQTTIVRALSHKDSFEEGTKAFSWLSRIMYNCFVTAYKRKVRFESKYDPESEIEKAKTESSQENKVLVKEVQKAITNLCPQHQQILFLICTNEMTYDEAASYLRVPVGTVRSRLSRARESLNELVANDIYPNAYSEKISRRSVH